MARLHPVYGLLWLALYIGGSTLLGAHVFAAWIWTVSPAANFLFIIGSATSGILGYQLHKRRGFAISVLAALGVAFLTYWISAIAVFQAATPPDQRAVPTSNPLVFAGLIAWVGIVGLLWCAFTPALLSLLHMKAQLPEEGPKKEDAGPSGPGEEKVPMGPT